MFFCIPLLVIPLFWSFSLLVCVLRMKKTILDILEISVWFLVYGALAKDVCEKYLAQKPPIIRFKISYSNSFKEMYTHIGVFCLSLCF